MKFNISNKAYDALKWIATYLLPGVGTVYFALSKTFNLPDPQTVVGLITIADAILGCLIGISSATYKGDGVIEVITGEDGAELKKMELNVDDVAQLVQKACVLLKVKMVGTDISSEETQN